MSRQCIIIINHDEFFSAFSLKSTDIRHHKKMRIHHSEKSSKSSSACTLIMIKNEQQLNHLKC